MRKVFLYLVLIVASTLSISAYVPGTNCAAIYQVPVGEPYNTRLVRPPYWTANRWDCLESAVGFTELENSPGDGVTTEYYLALRYSTPNGVTFYPVLYVDESMLHMWEFTPLSQDELSGWTFEQGTGKVTLTTAPAVNNEVYFEIY